MQALARAHIYARKLLMNPYGISYLCHLTILVVFKLGLRINQLFQQLFSL